MAILPGAYSIGVTYASCSPFRVLITKLVAAQTAIQEKLVAKAELIG